MKIALFETEEWERAACQRLLPDHEVVCTRDPLIREEVEVFRSERRGTEADPRALLADRVLPHFPSVIVTPHIAFDTDGAARRIIDTTLENIVAFAQGRPRNVVVDSGGLIAPNSQRAVFLQQRRGSAQGESHGRA